MSLHKKNKRVEPEAVRKKCKKSSSKKPKPLLQDDESSSGEGSLINTLNSLQDETLDHVKNGTIPTARTKLRRVHTINTLTIEDDDLSANSEPIKSPPDFVESKHQRRAGDDHLGTFAPDWVALVTGTNKAEYLVLAQIAYWFAESKKGRLKVKEHSGNRYWLYKTYRQIAKDTRVLNCNEVRWAIRKLETRGILITDYNPKRSKPKFYRINPVVVDALIDKAEQRLTDIYDQEGDEDFD